MTATARKRKPTQIQGIKTKELPQNIPQIKWSEKVLPAFFPFWSAYRANKHLFYVLKGGRSSSKSTHIAEAMIKELMELPINMLAIRKVGRTLEESVFEQLKWAIDFLEVSHLFAVRTHPLRITYKPRGNYITFRGADDPAKIKSLKSSKFPIARLWVEELAEFKTEEEVKTIVNSIVRAELPDGLTYKVLYSYNPPKRKQSWVNKRFNSKVDRAANTFVHHSTYLDNPYISKAFVEEAEEVKRRNPKAYEWEYLGKAIGAGVVPFENLVFRTITKEELENFDNFRNGIDWGYANDPFAFVRWHYDKTRRTIYAVGEIYEVKLSNREAAQKIKKNGWNDVETICDSAEPKSTAELKSYDINAKDAKKGPGSVEHGEKWLDELEAIVIDANLTPNLAKEFEDIDYAIDVYGNVKNRLEDINNHTIDSTRYAFNRDMKARRELKAAARI